MAWSSGAFPAPNMNPTESLVSLVSELTFKRWVALVAVIFTVFACMWLGDMYLGYSKYHRAERALALIEKLDAMDQKPAASPELKEVRIKAIQHVTALIDAERVTIVLDGGSFIEKWGKFASGALPCHWLS